VSLLLCYSETQQFDKAFDLARQMLKNKNYISKYTDVQLKNGRILKKAGRTKQAIELFEQISKNTAAPAAQAEAWYELALIYQHVYGDMKKAREYYEKVLSGSGNEEVRRMAQEHKSALDQLDAYRKVLDNDFVRPDSSDSAGPGASVDSTMPPEIIRYKMGELFWLQLEEPDSALVYFEALTGDTTAGDSLQVQALYTSAWLTLYMKKDSSRADSLFNVVIARSPASLYAKRSQAELGVPVTVKTREDSAHLAFLAAEKLFFDDNDALAASREFLKVAKKYPDLDVGPQSMYSAAWLCDNVLNKNVTARKIYKALCDSFPKSELCLNEARPRLKIVEDTLQAMKTRSAQTRRERKVQAGQDTGQDLTGEQETVETEEDQAQSGQDGQDAESGLFEGPTDSALAVMEQAAKDSSAKSDTLTHMSPADSVQYQKMKSVYRRMYPRKNRYMPENDGNAPE
jgi:tetratricopeptide (TPR) repeat protein